MKLKNLLKMAMVAILITTLSSIAWGQEPIYLTGFESSQSFTAGTVYNNTTIKYDGPQGQQWGTYFGTTSTTGAISGAQSMQMRWYSGTPGNLGYTFTNFDLPNVTYITFLASNTSTVNVVVSFSTDGGATYTGAQTYTLTATPTQYTYNVSQTGEYQNVRLKFQIAYTTTPTSPSRLYIDNVSVWGKSDEGSLPVISNITQSPSGLIQSNTLVSVSANITDADGTIEHAEVRWGFSPLELNNANNMEYQGDNLYTSSPELPAQYNGTTIYYAVYAIDNDGGESITNTQSYTVSPVTLLETFNLNLNNFTTYSVSGESRTWGHATSSSNGFAQMNGFGSDTLEVDWLFMPVLNLTEQDYILSFDTWKRYGVTNQDNYLKLYYSSDYPGQGDPTSFTWVELPYTQPDAEQVWVSSGTIDLSAITGTNVYIGIKYQYNVGNFVQWRVDNLKLEKKTYTVTFNVVDATFVVPTPPAESAVTVSFYNINKQTNAQGQVVYNWVEPGTNIPYFVTKAGFHNLTGVVTVINKNITQQLNLINNKAASTISANPEANSATITWEGEGAENYGIHYYEPGTQNEYYVSSATKPKVIVVSPSTNYNVRVRSMINGVWSRYSAVTEFTTQAGTPVIATNVQVGSITSSSALVSWSGSGAQSYGVYCYNTATGTGQYYTTTASSMSVAVLPGAGYGVRVRTLVDGQWTPYSQAVLFDTPAGAQQLATNVQVGSITPNSAQVSWDGSGAERYGIHYYEIGGPEFYTSQSTSGITLNLQPDKNYAVRVRSRVNGQWTSYTAAVMFSTPTLLKQESAVSTIETNMELGVYPNPATDNMRIIMSLGKSENITVTISDLRGTVVYTKQMKDRMGVVEDEVPVGQLGRGIYLLRVTTSSGFNETRRVVVQ
jgi:hypothetical protein